MAKSTVPHKVPVSGIFRVPKGAEENFTITDAPPSTVPSEQETEGYYIDVGVYEEPAPFLPPPTTWVVLDQTIRSTTSGQQVVDVVIEVTDVLGAIEYEVEVVAV